MRNRTPPINPAGSVKPGGTEPKAQPELGLDLDLRPNQAYCGSLGITRVKAALSRCTLDGVYVNILNENT